MFDDVQRLRPGQRATLYKELLDHRAAAPVWLAERTAVLESSEIFSDAIQRRDFEVVEIERGWQKLSDKRFLTFVTGIAEDRNSVVWGKIVSVRVDLGGRRTIKK